MSVSATVSNFLLKCASTSIVQTISDSLMSSLLSVIRFSLICFSLLVQSIVVNVFYLIVVHNDILNSINFSFSFQIGEEVCCSTMRFVLDVVGAIVCVSAIWTRLEMLVNAILSLIHVEVEPTQLFAVVGHICFKITL